MSFKVINSRRGIFSPFSLKAFICDSADDINNLPRFGILGRQDNDPISVCACAYGSTALVCNGSITETYILTPNNEWVKKTESHSGGGGAIIEPLEVTENGTYTPPEGVDGYSPVSVSVASSGGGDGPEKYIEAKYETVELPNATAIKPYAFCADSTLKNIIMPKVTIINGKAFQNCPNLALTELPAGLTSIGSDAFAYCSSLALTELPAGLTSVQSDAFAACTSLALTGLPDGLTSISSNAFKGCTNLALTKLPTRLTTINSYTFWNCPKLALTELPDSLTKIDSSAFQNCTGLTTLTFKRIASSINSSAFSGCTNLTTINVPWAEGAVKNAPWGAENATINYNYTGE